MHSVKNTKCVGACGGEVLAVLVNKKIDALLEATSRSFYPTLKYLPKKIRGQIGLLYLLARVADTIADSKHGETKILLDTLKQYNEVHKAGQISYLIFPRYLRFKTMKAKLNC